MILVYEPTWTGTDHAPGNSATVQVIAHAFPHERIRILADPAHLAELRRDAALTSLGRVDFVAVPISPLFPSRPQLVVARRLWHEFRVMRAALRAALRAAVAGENVLLLLISTTATSLFAASWLVRRYGSRLGVLIGWHGNLNDALGWRPRNPLARMLDFRAGLLGRHPDRVRFLVLEEGIRDAMARHWPDAARRTDVLPLPINLAEMPADTHPMLDRPIRVGLVGQATAAKGSNLFLEAARAMQARHGDRVEFHLVGRLADGVDPAPYSVLARVPTHEHLSRADFTARLARLHYVFLPLDVGYYGLAASGALIDAITWLKPIIVPRVPIVEALFRAHGDIGHLADRREDMVAVLDAVISAADAPRYAAQVAALGAARAARTPQALAATFRASLRQHMPGLLREDD